VVFVETGSEARPTGTLVFWVGGTTQPTNMGTTDLWFSEGGAAPAGDTAAPSAPTGLTSSAITSTGFTLTWTASTDNVGVVGYDIYRGASLHASVTGLTANITGLTASTAYSMTVKARDAVGNVSAASTALSVTTGAASGTPQHSIWGSGAYPFAVTKNTDSPLTVANQFYSYGTSPNVSAWRVVGMKIWIPAGVTLTGPVACKGWFGGNSYSIAAAPVATATLTTPVSGQWNTVTFDTPIETNSGDPVWIGYRCPAGEYLGLAPDASFDNFITATDGSHIVLCETNTGNRGQYRYDSGTTGFNHVVYGVDVIYDEGPGA
jgi:chitodextrinase